ncbi:MAG: hypothetical protein GXP37_02130 [Chloroflexi bacterium]|nr:hypothetical protein [Chloroflexota bacterium]
MLSLSQHLGEQPLTVVQAIAQRQGLVAASARKDDLCAAIMVAVQDPEHRAWVWSTLSPPARRALMRLDAAQNRMTAASFQRQFGEIRRLGEARLQQEQPWLHPLNAAEELWYTGYLLRAFRNTDDGIVELCSIPAELLPLPETLPPATGFQFERLPPPASVPPETDDDADTLLEDLASLLIYVRDHRLWLNAGGGWRQHDMDALQKQWRHRPTGPDDCYPDLVLHCARRQKLLMRRFRQQQLPRQQLQQWLQMSRAHQARAAFIAWRESPHWDDLCRTPGLICGKGNWQHDPFAARHAILDILQREQPWQWRRLADIIAAIHEQMPDFQRPDGNYHTWYVRDAEGVYLHGFENWEKVEGRVIAYLWQQPLHYLGLIVWDTQQRLWALSERGHTFVHDAPLPTPPPSPAILVTDDFHIDLPPQIPLIERFRITRFALWESSVPQFRYRITQRSLNRAARLGIRPQTIAHYLAQASHEQAPANVIDALTRFQVSS